MPVRGGEQVADRLRRAPQQARNRLEDAIRDGGELVLSDMRALTPIDADNPGPHARNGLTMRFDEQETKALVGLPTRDLASDYFWFRFLDGGTRGGTYRAKRAVNGDMQRYDINVPSRPALNIRQRALNRNIDEITRLVSRALQNSIGGVR